ncbi:outer membrane immunogenic protein [Peteryoungia aggregata LMG 23059]|uniref:Outer membrane immunogenic protein n=1 Tax=Peteryoungia aggregata LMG 23059 TaxID=1368425 RepID=A0ABU0G1D7_9HYPH|nr:outer membrane protein [Peteryoungia aggregata]MDQ0419146.1 outer membrane immunogenic protein [Peteryoungia aggregata LMG 23059]
MQRILLLGVLAGLGLAGGAQAADAVSAPAEPPPMAEEVSTWSWAGGYAGVQGGYGWGDTTLSQGGTGGDVDFDGGRFGGFAGYNWTAGSSFVVGLEADLAYDWNEYSAGTETLKTTVQGGLRARAGYAVDRALFYAAGGWTATQLKYEDTGVDISETLNGWTIGAGLDYALTDRIFARGEYRYNDYGSETVDGTDIDFNQHVVQVGLGVRF